MTLFKELYLYQKERFPLKILLFTTLVTIACSWSVLNYDFSWQQALIAFFACMFMLFHIRVNDEFRDFEHDATHHKDHPQHKGVISMKSLRQSDTVGLVIYCILCIISGIPALVYGILLLLFVALARKDFFMRDYFKNRPLMYHVINSPQMVLMQLQIFAIFTGSFELSTSMLYCFGVVYANIFVLEVVRKIKLPNNEPGSHNTYSYIHGFSKALFIAWFWGLISCIFTFLLIHYFHKNPLELILYSSFLIFIFLIFSFLYFFHSKKMTLKTEKLTILISVLFYLLSNLIIIVINMPW